MHTDTDCFVPSTSRAPGFAFSVCVSAVEIVLRHFWQILAHAISDSRMQCVSVVSPVIDETPNFFLRKHLSDALFL